MPYPTITARRMPFDIDGTAVGYRAGGYGSMANLFGQGIASWLDSSSIGNLNKENRAQAWGISSAMPAWGFWFFFPESREITHIGLLYPTTPNDSIDEQIIQGSNDTTNGMDGTWETGVYTFPEMTTDADQWRSDIFAISFSGPMKCIRIGQRHTTNFAASMFINAVHVYGHKAAGQTPDDIIFCDSAGTEKTSLMDWGDVPEGTTEIDTFYVKNVSSKQANGINIQLNHADFVISTDQVNWGAVVDITSLTAGQISAPIYVKLALNPPLLTLGPKSARAIVTVTSWTA